MFHVSGTWRIGGGSTESTVRGESDSLKSMVSPITYGMKHERKQRRSSRNSWLVGQWLFNVWLFKHSLVKVCFFKVCLFKLWLFKHAMSHHHCRDGGDRQDGVLLLPTYVYDRM
jgi:hypothetical protein